MIRRRPVRGGRIEDGTGEPVDSGGAEPLTQALSPEQLQIGRLQAALDLIEDGVVVSDAEGHHVFRNAVAQRHLSGHPDEVLADQAVTETLRHALRGEYPERRLDLFSPVPRQLVIRAFPIEGLANPHGAVAVVVDVTERQRLESIRRDFVANVSHELKTPVGALSLLAETLDGEEDSEVVARLASRVAAEAERLGRIIDDLLDLSRIEANETPRQEMVPLQIIVGQAVEPLRRVATSAGVTLEVDDPPSHLAVPGDRRDLVSAVTNLVDNAIKYSEGGDRVQVRVLPNGDEVDISVVDEGVGIPARDLQRIFERFYRVDRARSRSTGGTGLGLSIVRHVAVNHAGSVHVRSQEGDGSTFTLRLPARVIPGRAIPTRRDEAKHSGPPRTAGTAGTAEISGGSPRA